MGDPKAACNRYLISLLRRFSSCLIVSTSVCVVVIPDLISCSLSSALARELSILAERPCDTLFFALCSLLDIWISVCMIAMLSVIFIWFAKAFASCAFIASKAFPISSILKSNFLFIALSILLRWL